jgi:hypothetical protein
MIGRRPSACPEGHRVRRKGERWWCFVCDREVEPRARPTIKLARSRVQPLGSEHKRTARRLRAYGTDERLAWLHSLPCVAARCPGHRCDPWDMETGRAVIQAVHVRARGAGGTADDQVPGCAAFHREAGELGTTQRRECEARYGLDLVAKAAEYAERWRAVDTTGATC